MSQYSALVEKQKLLIEAEKWAIEIKNLHCHSLSSMYYDDRPQDTDGKSVMDIQYNGGWIERWQEGKHIHTFGKKLDREELIDAYGKSQVR